VATMLAWTSMDAPDGLWDRIASELDEVAPPPRGELASVLALGQHRQRRGSSSAPRWWTGTAAAAAAAVAGLLIGGLVVGSVLGGRDDGAPSLLAAVEQARADRDSSVTELARADGAVGAEVIIDQDGHGYLLGAALPELPSDQTYQLWGVIGDQVISLGVLGRNPEIELFSASEPVSRLVVTIEPAGGVVSNGNPDGAYAGSVI
jgi:anti-sigma-K factor RskA